MDPFTSSLGKHRNTVLSLLKFGRISEWWEFKLVPALMISYATSIHLEASPWASAGSLVLLLLALLPGGIFVSVLNDLTDLADDTAAAKTNCQEGKNPTIPILIIVLSLTAGVILLWVWRNEPQLMSIYFLGWIAFTFYSLPPFRLKTVGLPGILCDAIGAHFVPAMLAAFLVANSLARDLDIFWLFAVGSWSFFYGLRGILWHQIGDFDADRLSKTRTFVARYGPKVALRGGKWIFFPLEMFALSAIIWQIGIGAMTSAIVGLFLYAALEYGRIDRFEMTITIVEPKPRSSIILHEYYDVMLPLALLICGVFLQWEAIAVLLSHCVLFPFGLKQVMKDFVKFLDPQYQRRSKR